MKTLKLRNAALIFGSLLFALVFAPAVQARGGGERGAGHERGGERGGNIDQRIEKMTEHLDLSSDQASQIRAILESAKVQAETLRDQDGDRAAKRDALMAIHENSREQIKAVLNAEQLSKFEEMAEHRREKRGERKGRRGGRGDRGNGNSGDSGEN